MPPSAMKESKALCAAFHKRRDGRRLEAARNAWGKFTPEPRAETTVGRAVSPR